MTFQEKLEKAALKANKKIFDNNIRITGQEIQILRLRTTENIYGDDETIEIVKDGLIDVVIDLPVDIPLSRYRGNASTEANKEGIFLFDIIPIFIYYQWTPKDDSTIKNGNIEQGDYLIYIVNDDSIKIPIIFRVTEILGSMRKNMIYRKARIAPYNGQLETMIQNKISDYINNS